VWIARGADEGEWRRTRILAEVLNAQWSKRELPPEFCNPYFKATPHHAVSEKLQASRWQAFEGAAREQGWGTIVTGVLP